MTFVHDDFRTTKKILLSKMIFFSFSTCLDFFTVRLKSVENVFCLILMRTLVRTIQNPKLKIHATYDSAIQLLGIHTEEAGSERDTCTPMFIAALLIIARTWKQPRCPSAHEWIRKLWYIYTMEYYSAIKIGRAHV